MQRVFPLCILLFASSIAFGQSQNTNTLQNCQGEWQYKDLHKSLNGSIVFYEQPIVLCGIVSTACVALIKVDSGEIIRVLTMCNNKKNFNTPAAFKVGERVVVSPNEKPSFKVDLMPIDAESCSLKTAYFGSIQKVK